jgi:hypothetical protein
MGQAAPAARAGYVGITLEPVVDSEIFAAPE